jgi:ADP-L-glycero-D-manno-heptose 6-epimerase
MHLRKHSGIYNLGTGKARTFKSLAEQTFKSMNKTLNVEFVDIPADIRDTYQYFTQASMSKLKKIGYSSNFYSLEDGIDDYVQNYLMKSQYL